MSKKNIGNLNLVNPEKEVEEMEFTEIGEEMKEETGKEPKKKKEHFKLVKKVSSAVASNGKKIGAAAVDGAKKVVPIAIGVGGGIIAAVTVLSSIHTGSGENSDPGLLTDGSSDSEPTIEFHTVDVDGDTVEVGTF